MLPLAVALLVGASLKTSPPPAWVEEADVPIPAKANGSPVERFLIDAQMHVQGGERVRFQRLVKRLNTPDGVGMAGEIMVEYDPEYEAVTFHRVQIRRGDRILDAAKKADLRVLQRESSLEQRLLDGRLQAMVILQDVRPGDVIDVAWSISGDPPQLAGHFAQVVNLGSERDVQRLRYIVTADRALQLRLRPGAPAPEERLVDGLHQYRWDRHAPPAVTWEPDVPSWFNPAPAAELTDFESWSAVAKWADALVQPEAPGSPEIAQLVAPWRNLPEAERAQAALRFVREEIRYLGLENGIHGHRAHRPAQVLERRFGDCKDKAVLLASLLREMGIESDVALVNPERRDKLDERLPSPYAFDHAIARAVIGGKERWLDATITSQRGALDALPVVPYARALVAGPATQGLAKLPPPRDDATLVEEVFHARDSQGDASFTVETTYRGGGADQERSMWPGNTPAEAGRQFLSYYTGRHTGIELAAAPAFRDEPEQDRFHVTESYKIQRFWWSHEHDISSDQALQLSPPRRLERTQPYALPYPWHVIQRTRVELPGGDWKIEPVDREVKAPGFVARVKLKTVTEKDGPVFLLETDARTTGDSIAPDEVARFAEGLLELHNVANRTLYLGSAAPVAGASAVSGAAAGSWALALAGVMLAILFLANRFGGVGGGPARAKQFFRRTVPALGESPATPLAARTPEDLKTAARARRCVCGRSHAVTVLRAGQSSLLAGQTVHSVRLECYCGQIAVLYFVES
ncbi:MAG: DUF3857 domain-containing protein [Deltaproteobacteria bacterium]|nr:MAG: DUF3857 domain-containing protein [Deltaproteobacteria bacterium]